jgi:hypothetical protein
LCLLCSLFSVSLDGPLLIAPCVSEKWYPINMKWNKNKRLNIYHAYSPLTPLLLQLVEHGRLEQMRVICLLAPNYMLDTLISEAVLS